MPPDFALEAAGPAPVAGVDEVGRGPLAGPLVAAAVVLDPARLPPGLDDSKKLTVRAREACDAAIRQSARAISLAVIEVAELDLLGMTAAVDAAMCRAVAGLPFSPARALIDGRRVPPDLACPGEAVVRGDGRALSIAAASIVAKVARDAIMQRLAEQHPGYGWETNAGYGSAAHKAALAELGVTPHHRRSFAPIRLALQQNRLR